MSNEQIRLVIVIFFAVTTVLFSYSVIRIYNRRKPSTLLIYFMHKNEKHTIQLNFKKNVGTHVTRALLDFMQTCLNANGMLTIADLIAILKLDMNSSSEEEEYGWIDISSAKESHKHNAYMIDLPATQHLRH